MKKISFIIIILILSISINATTVYENAEDGSADRWILQGSGNNAINTYSHSSNSKVIRFEGMGGPWIIGAVSGELAWNNRSEKTISWRMVTSDRYTVFVVIDTTFGTRYLFYNDLPKRVLRHNMAGLGILHGLGGYQHSEYKGVWRTYTRDLEADLKDSEPDNELISVNAFIYSGSDASIDDIILYNPEEQVYEDGSGVANWSISDNDPVGATITTINDPQGEHVHGAVIQFQGSGMDNSYVLGIDNSEQDILQWKSRYYENYSVSVMVQTTEGSRELLYTNSHDYIPSGGVINGGQTIWHEMGGRSIIGVNGWEQRRDFGAVNHFWQTITRDLRQDIKSFEPNNELLSVDSFEVIGGSAINDRVSGLIDGVKMLSRAVIADPNDDIVYEDAENGDIEGWHIYDNSPEHGVAITNVVDATKNSRVIQLDSNGVGNGFELGRRVGEGQWNNRDHQAIRWSMNYSEAFAIYVALETSDGVRYMKYEPRDDDGGRVGNYIQIGLGTNSTNGTWQTFSRNLEDDLHQFEPNNQLVAIHAFLIRGSGRLDDIETFRVDEIVYEDAENGDTEGWSIYSNTSGEATISNIEDNERDSRVIELSGQGRADGYMIGGLWGTNMWNDRDHDNIRWSMNYGEDFSIYISVQTTNGHRYLLYTAIDDNGGLDGEYIRLGLGADINDGTWRTINRNLAEDILEIEVGNELISVDAFMIRGSGRFDDIVMF